MKEILYIVIPCYNEQEVLPVTAPLFGQKIESMVQKEMISPESRILFVDDGSTDNTWNVIVDLSEKNSIYCGIRQSRNRGHQNALLAGLMEVKEKADITITIDCDGQDDLDAMDEMVKAYQQGCDIVYGVRSNRKTDKVFKRTTAQCFYKFLHFMGAEVVYNHADYRMVSSKVLREFANFKEVNLFLRGMFPLVGFKSTSVYYERKERMAGKTHYPLKKMLMLAFDGITSLTIKPLRMIAAIGAVTSFVSLLGVIYAVVEQLRGNVVTGWASTICCICFMGGIQLICLGVLGEYIGKIYMEVKHRPRYIISERTEDVHHDRE